MQLADLYSGRDDWQRARVDAVATPVRETVDPATLNDQDVFHISIPALEERGGGRSERASSIGSQKLWLRGGEVLIAKLNPRKSRVVLVPPRPEPILASSEFIALQPSSNCEPRFLVWMLRSRIVRQWLDSQVRSVTRSHQRVDPRAITQAQFWLPSRDEQRNIADFLDLEVIKLDELIRLKRELALRLPERLSAVMHAAVADLPRTEKLGYCGDWLSGGTPPKDEPEHWSGTLPWASTKDLSADSLRDTIDHVTSEAAETHSRLAPAGSLLIATRGMALAKRLPLAVTQSPMAFNQDLKALVPEGRIEPDYLRIALRGYQSELLAAVVESAHGTRRLETRHLKSLRIAIPTASIQARIMAEVCEVEAQIQEADQALQRQMDLLHELRDTFITTAISGELDPSSYQASAVAA